MRPEGLCQRKIPVTPSGIELATFLLVAQCLNQLRAPANKGIFINNFKINFIYTVDNMSSFCPDMSYFFDSKISVWAGFLYLHKCPDFVSYLFRT